MKFPFDSGLGPPSQNRLEPETQDTGARQVGFLVSLRSIRDSRPTLSLTVGKGAMLALDGCQSWCHYGAMNLAMYVESLRDHLVATAEMGGAESKAVVERLSAGLEAATRLVLLETLSAAADEITADLAPGAVEIRLRGSDPYFVVTLPSDPVSEIGAEGTTTPLGVRQGGEEGGTSRLNLRLPEALKVRMEEAARREGLSLNAWLVRASAAAAERPLRQMPRNPGGSQRYTGWVR
jgi:hypothetical protein